MSTSVHGRDHAVLLPPELITQILQLSIPPTSYSTQSERTTHLKSLALVSSHWLTLVRHALYSTILVRPAPVHFDNPNRSAQRLADVLKESPHLAGLVTELRFRKGRGKRGPRLADGTDLHMERLLRVCTSLEKVVVVECKGVDVTWLASCPNLKSLLLHESKTVLPTTITEDEPWGRRATLFPKLETLELSSEYRDPTAYSSFPALCPKVFPALKDLRLVSFVTDSLSTTTTTTIDSWPQRSLTLSHDCAYYLPTASSLLTSRQVLWDFQRPSQIWSILNSSNTTMVEFSPVNIRYIPLVTPLVSSGAGMGMGMVMGMGREASSHGVETWAHMLQRAFDIADWEGKDLVGRDDDDSVSGGMEEEERTATTTSSNNVGRLRSIYLPSQLRFYYGMMEFLALCSSRGIKVVFEDQDSPSERAGPNISNAFRERAATAP